MRKFLIASTIISAFTMAGSVMAAPVASSTWTGYYIGGNVGYGWGDDSMSSTGRYLLGAGGALPPGSATQHMDGAFVGVQGGYNWQFAPAWVAGLEADFQFSAIQGTVECFFACNTGGRAFGVRYSEFTVSDRLNSFGTVRGRFGYAMGSTLFYGTGGLAFGDINRSDTVVGSSGAFGPFAGGYGASVTKTGWAAGGGIETKLSAAWTAKVEYLHIDLGHVSDTVNEVYVAPVAGAYQLITTSIRDDIVRLGVNYQFNH